jgi:hypothetical protein
MKTIAALVFTALAGLPMAGLAQQKIDLLSPSGTNVSRWGAPFPLQATVTNCASPFSGTVFVRDITTGYGVGSGSAVSSAAGCASTIPLTFGWDLIAPGWQFLQATVGGASSPPVPFRFDHEFDFAFRGDRLKATLSTDPHYVSCAVRQVKILDRESLGLAMPPANLRTPYEMIVVAGGTCTPGSSPFSPQLLAIELPEKVGDVWRYQPGGWVRMTDDCGGFATCPPFPRVAHLGNSAVLELNASGNSVFAVLAIAYPQFDARATDLQGLWWSGPSESGWGLTIAKSGERMFVAGYVYDKFGKPTWVVMPNGVWDPNTLVFYGDLYIPKSNPYTSYAGAGLDMRAPVGKGSLSFLSGDEGHFDYTMGDYAGGKTINRYTFAPAGKDKPPYSGIWWGGPLQDGWGLSVEQQGETVFATWYTYGADFEPVWFYMPAGQKAANGKYTGTLYRTTGSPWAGFHYDGRTTQSIAVGTMELQFATDAKSGTMTSVVDGRTIVNPIQRFDF